MKMPINKGIRRIRLAERVNQHGINVLTGEQERVSPMKITSSNEAARIVSSWINELRLKKRAELAMAYTLKNSSTEIPGATVRRDKAE